MFQDEESSFDCLDTVAALGDFFSAAQQKVRADPSFMRALIGARRCGKTTLFAGEAIELAEQFPGRSVPYLANTVGRARDIMLPILRKMRDEQHIALEFRENKVFTPSGGVIQLGGLATRAEVEKGRGGSYPGLYIDECGAVAPHLLQTAVIETYGPAVMDFYGLGGRGITLGGTPQHGPKAYWEEMCGGNTHVSEHGASVHHMTIWDNPFFKGREQIVIDAWLKIQGLKITDAPVLREWFGKFCLDTKGLAYPSWRGLVQPQHLMPLTGFTVLGVDLGSVHPCAWVVVRFHIVETIIGDKVRYIHHGHVLESYEESGLKVHDVAAITRQFQQTYNVGATYADSGGGGKMTVDTINEVMSVPMNPVAKAGVKEDRIWMTDSMLGNGTLHVHDQAQTLAHQLGSVPKERNKRGLMDHMAGYPDHSCDALHYALLGAKQHKIEIVLPPRPGTREWVLEQQRQDVARVSVSLPGLKDSSPLGRARAQQLLRRQALERRRRR